MRIYSINLKEIQLSPEILMIDTSMNGNLRTTLATGQVIWDLTNVICHSISTNRPSAIWSCKSNYKGVY